MNVMPLEITPTWNSFFPAIRNKVVAMPLALRTLGSNKYLIINSVHLVYNYFCILTYTHKLYKNNKLFIKHRAEFMYMINL
jgi:hypothetical protein